MPQGLLVINEELLKKKFALTGLDNLLFTPFLAATVSSREAIRHQTYKFLSFGRCRSTRDSTQLRLCLSMPPSIAYSSDNKMHISRRRFFIGYREVSQQNAGTSPIA